MKVIAHLPVKESLKQSLRVSEGRDVKVGNRRFCVANLKTFAVHGCKCVRCGRTGDRIVAWEDRGGGLHVDLFSGNILMNRDHIIPKSKKGGNTDWNYQTMCVKCNSKKGNNETPGDKELSKFRNHWRNIHMWMHDSYWKVVPPCLRGKLTTTWFIKFRERHLHHFSYAIAKLTHAKA